MTDSQPGGPQDVRRTQILRAALDVIVDRGYSDARITDVAERVAVSPALVMYYFRTKDHLLAEATRYAEDLWYEEGTRRMKAIPSAAGRLEELVRMTCLPQPGKGLSESRSLWLDLWAQAMRQPAVRTVREEFDEHWRETIRQIARDGQAAGEFADVDADDFALSFSALLDGFAVQIALADPVAGVERCFELSMRFAAGQLGFEWPGPPRPPPRPSAAPRPRRPRADRGDPSARSGKRG
jgi:AcrR family transcriptional regulator